MKNIKNVFLFEFKSKSREKSIIISTIIMIILFLGVTFIPSFIKEDKPKTIEEEIKEMGKIGFVIEDERIDENKLKAYMPFKIAIKYQNEKEIIKAIEDKEVNHGIILKTQTHYELIKSGDVITFIDALPFLGVDEGLLSYNRNNFFEENNINPNIVNEFEQIKITSEVKEIGKSAENNYWVAYVGTFIIYFLIIVYGISVATSVAREKNDRTMEILITNTSSKSLIVGKVFASLAISVIQVILILSAGIIGFMINKGNYPEVLLNMINNNISIPLIIVFLVFTALGSLMYYFVYAALGSLVSRVEDVNNSVGPIQIIFIAAFMIAMTGMYNPSGTLMVITSFVPFTSPMSMFVRYAMVNIPIYEVIISLLILIITTIILAILSIKIYRKATLNYGNRLSLRKVFKDLKKEI